MQKLLQISLIHQTEVRRPYLQPFVVEEWLKNVDPQWLNQIFKTKEEPKLIQAKIIER